MWRHSVVDGKTQCLQGHVYLAWVRPSDLTTGKFEISQSQVGEYPLPLPEMDWNIQNTMQLNNYTHCMRLYHIQVDIYRLYHIQVGISEIISYSSWHIWDCIIFKLTYLRWYHIQVDISEIVSHSSWHIWDCIIFKLTYLRLYHIQVGISEIVSYSSWHMRLYHIQVDISEIV